MPSGAKITINADGSLDIENEKGGEAETGSSGGGRDSGLGFLALAGAGSEAKRAGFIRDIVNQKKPKVRICKTAYFKYLSAAFLI